MTEQDIRDAQIALAGIGLYEGKIDGWLGPLMRRALLWFQEAFGLHKSGRIDEATRDALNPEPQLPRAPLAKEPQAVANDFPRQRDVSSYYGAVGTNQAMLQLPFPMLLAWDKGTKIMRFSVHEKVHDSALRCLNRIADAYDENKRVELGLNLFGGCLNVRKMRGGSSYSMHSWGIAIDFDPARNGVHSDHTQARLAMPDAETFWRIWEEEGWISLGRRCDYDWMHVQAAKL